MLEVERTDVGFRLTGILDEHADLSALPEGPLELDLSGVERVNSMGVVVWQAWRRKRSHPVTLRGVPVSFVFALNCVAGFAENMRIASVLAPFIDPSTGATEELMLDASVLAQVRSTGQCPPVRSATTSRLLELDDQVGQYFAFLHDQHGPSLVGDG